MVTNLSLFLSVYKYLTLLCVLHAIADTLHAHVCKPYNVVFIILQGPLGCQSFSEFPTGGALLHRDIDLLVSADLHAEISAVSWEATIQRHVEEELHGPLLEVWTFN